MHSVFAGAVNLRPAGGAALVSVVSDPGKAHPRAVVVAAQFDRWGLRPAGRGWFDGATLSFDNVVARLTVTAERRHPADEGVSLPRDFSAPLHWPSLQSAAAAIYARTATRAVAAPPGFQDSLKKASADLAVAVNARCVDSALAACRRLVGLGPGLTPSGDDFLCGCLAGWRAQASADPSLAAFLDALGAHLGSAEVLAATNAISSAFLAEAAQGRFGSALVAFAAAALGLTDGLDEAAEVLASLGHSSGTDAAAGFLFAFGKQIGG